MEYELHRVVPSGIWASLMHKSCDSCLKLWTQWRICIVNYTSNEQKKFDWEVTTTFCDCVHDGRLYRLNVSFNAGKSGLMIISEICVNTHNRRVLQTSLTDWKCGYSLSQIAVTDNRHNEWAVFREKAPTSGVKQQPLKLSHSDRNVLESEIRMIIGCCNITKTRDWRTLTTCQVKHIIISLVQSEQHHNHQFSRALKF